MLSAENKSITKLTKHLVNATAEMLRLNPVIPKKWIYAKEIISKLNTIHYIIHEGYAVHLLFECPNVWHFLSTPGYLLKRTKPIVNKYGKKAPSVTANLIKRRRHGKLYTSRIIAENMEKYLHYFKDEFNFTEKLSFDDSLKYLTSSNDLNKRELKHFLTAVDNEGRFGNLVPIIVGENILWLCEEHARC